MNEYQCHGRNAVLPSHRSLCLRYKNPPSWATRLPTAYNFLCLPLFHAEGETQKKKCCTLKFCLNGTIAQRTQKRRYLEEDCIKQGNVPSELQVKLHRWGVTASTTPNTGIHPPPHKTHLLLLGGGVYKTKHVSSRPFCFKLSSNLVDSSEPCCWAMSHNDKHSFPLSESSPSNWLAVVIMFPFQLEYQLRRPITPTFAVPRLMMGWYRSAQIPDASSPRRLLFLRWRLQFVSSLHVTLPATIISTFLENLWTPGTIPYISTYNWKKKWKRYNRQRRWKQKKNQ